jgi:enoyl-CoA hydratase/carnithine racemase
MSDLMQVTPIDDGAFWRVTFGASTGNILDRRLMAALARTIAEARAARDLKALVLEGRGGIFLSARPFRSTCPIRSATCSRTSAISFSTVLDSHVFVVAAVNGQCLGGGLELASACHRIVAGAGAMFGQPEITLGVFAPIASILLPERIGRARAEDLCLTGERFVRPKPGRWDSWTTWSTAIRSNPRSPGCAHTCPDDRRRACASLSPRSGPISPLACVPSCRGSRRCTSAN